MRLRITRQWQVDGFPGTKLEPGQIFDLPSCLAVYFLVMRCAEAVSDPLTM